MRFSQLEKELNFATTVCAREMATLTRELRDKEVEIRRLTKEVADLHDKHLIAYEVINHLQNALQGLQRLGY